MQVPRRPDRGNATETGKGVHREVESEGSRSALVCFDNWRAVCTLVSLEKLGLKVPDDVSLIGSYRSREYPGYLLPRRITCFRMDARELWLEGLRLLFEMIDSPENVIPKNISLNPAFVPGDTVKKLLPVRPDRLGLNNSPNE